MMIWDESISGDHYSVTVTFSVEVIVQSINGLESDENCSINSTQFSKTAKISCANLKHSTSYTLIFHGLVNFTDAVVPLQFIVNFDSKTVANEQVTGKRNWILHTCKPPQAMIVFCITCYHNMFSTHHMCLKFFA